MAIHFSLAWGRADELIRDIPQSDLNDLLLLPKADKCPDSLRQALAYFFVGATIKCITRKKTASQELPDSQIIEKERFSFLCHISQKKTHHQIAFEAISLYRQELLDALVINVNSPANRKVKAEFQIAYDDLKQTIELQNLLIPTFQEVLEEFSGYINNTDIQVLNSDKEEDAPSYNCRYNILIGGTKLARGVTIDNLIVTYYGRQSKTTNMDTVLQHARMYGYREHHLDVTRLFITRDIEKRFSEINESEQALRTVIEKNPDEKYHVIRIGRGLKPTRGNVLNPNNRGYFGAGSATFPHKPLYLKKDVESITQQIDDRLKGFSDKSSAEPVSIDEIIEIIKMTKAEKNGGGLWEESRVVTALETLKSDFKYNNMAFIVVRKNRDTGKNKVTGTVRAVLSGGEEDRLANPDYPTLFMFKQRGDKNKGWDDCAFWMPILRFPDGQYALEFNISN